MDWNELRDLRIKLVMSDLDPEGPVPKYWERDVPPGVVRVRDWDERNGLFSDDEAAKLLQKYVGMTVKTRWGAEVPVLCIITSEPWDDYTDRFGNPKQGAKHRFPESIGGGGNEERPSFTRYARVEKIVVHEREKIWEWPDGTLEKVPYKAYEAIGEEYEFEGRTGLRDSTYSGPERFEREGKGVVQYGAATALLARLLEIATD